MQVAERKMCDKKGMESQDVSPSSLMILDEWTRFSTRELTTNKSVDNRRYMCTRYITCEKIADTAILHMTRRPSDSGDRRDASHDNDKFKVSYGLKRVQDWHKCIALQ